MKPSKKPAKRVKAGTSKAAAAARRALFVEAYIANGGNAAQAAIAAGFAVKGARRVGTKLSTDVHIRAEIERRRAIVMKDGQAITGLTVERTLREIARIAYSDPRKLRRPDGSFIPFDEMDDDTAATVAGVEFDEIRADGAVIGHTTKIKTWDKNIALEKAAKILNLYKENNDGSRPLVQVAVVQLVALTPAPDRMLIDADS
jgi:phage terminase small subunit